MATYNERMAANNARLESILSRIQNFSGGGGGSHETCSVSLTSQWDTVTASRIVYYSVVNGQVQVKELTNVGEGLIASDVLRGSRMYVELAGSSGIPLYSGTAGVDSSNTINSAYKKWLVKLLDDSSTATIRFDI